jgi:ribosomal protein S18 acetylase RimI-like enzyme
MEPAHFLPGARDRTAVITRVAPRHWHALDDDRVVGRGEATERPDGRTFLSIDAWHSAVFDQLAAAMLADLPRPLHTVVDEADQDLIAHWHRAGFTTRRREWECLVPTDLALDPRMRPGLVLVPFGEADEDRLNDLDRDIRAEVDATLGWSELPVEVLPRPADGTVVDPSKYAVAELSGLYVGMLWVGALARTPRIGLVAVRAAFQRQRIATTLLAYTLDHLRRRGFRQAFADVAEVNEPATALFDGIGARRVSSNLELVIR